jgi:hypothetical protein
MQSYQTLAARPRQSLTIGATADRRGDAPNRNVGKFERIPWIQAPQRHIHGSVIGFVTSLRFGARADWPNAGIHGRNENLSESAGLGLISDLIVVS